MNRTVKEWLHKNMGKPSEQICPIRVYKHPYSLDREKMARLFKGFEFKKGAEIGVRRGEFSEYMLKVNPDLNLTLVDPWWTEDITASRRGEKRQSADYENCMNRMKQYGSRVQILKMTSMDAINQIPDNSLDFVYIDGCHEFDYVMRDVIEWARKVKPGGIVSGHDYYRFKNAGVVEAIDAYTKMHRINEWFLTNERAPSWFWAK